MKRIANFTNMIMSFNSCERFDREKDAQGQTDVWEITWNHAAEKDDRLFQNIWNKNKNEAVATAEWYDAIGMKATSLMPNSDVTLTGMQLYQKILQTCGTQAFYNLMAEENIEYNIARETETREREMGDDQMPGHYELYGPDPIQPQAKAKRKVIISKAKWEEIGKSTGWLKTAVNYDIDDNGNPFISVGAPGSQAREQAKQESNERSGVVYNDPSSPCPKCGCPEHNILNATQPTINECTKCQHKWNPLNEQRKTAGDMGEMWKEYNKIMRENKTPCPVCNKKEPKRTPTNLLPGQKCKVCGYTRPNESTKTAGNNY